LQPQSDVDQAFSTEKRFLGKPRHFCPDCTVKRKTRSFIWDLVIIAGCGLFISVMSPSSNATDIVLHLSLILVFLVPLILIHELTHAGVAKLLGLRVFGIIIGIGKTIWSGKLFGTDWTINLLPLGGITLVGTRPLPFIRLKLFLIFLAGPASHVIMAVVFFLWQQTLSMYTFGYQALMSLVIANVVGCHNLHPFKVTDHGHAGHHGWHLLHVPFLDEADKQALYWLFCREGSSPMPPTISTQQKVGGSAFSFDSTSGSRATSWASSRWRVENISFTRNLFADPRNEDAKELGLHYILLNNVASECPLRDPALRPKRTITRRKPSSICHGCRPSSVHAEQCSSSWGNSRKASSFSKRLCLCTAISTVKH
jgi:hypothetical protein